MKKIIILVIISLITLIPITTNKENIYLILDDNLNKGITPYGNIGYKYETYIKEKFKGTNIYSIKNCSNTNEIIEIIENNEKIDDKNIQNILYKSKVLILSTGLNEILEIINRNYNDTVTYIEIDKVIKKVEYLIYTIKKYNNSDIYILGYYNPYEKNNDKIIYANDKLMKLSTVKQINYINLYDLFNGNKHLFINNNMYPLKDGYILIGKEIVKNIKKI